GPGVVPLRRAAGAAGAPRGGRAARRARRGPAPDTRAAAAHVRLLTAPARTGRPPDHLGGPGAAPFSALCRAPPCWAPCQQVPRFSHGPHGEAPGSWLRVHHFARKRSPSCATVSPPV